MSFADLTRARYSCRSYEDRAIEPEKLAAVVEAGRIAPSATTTTLPVSLFATLPS